MKIYFKSKYVKVNGVNASKFFLEEGERIDLLYFEPYLVEDYAYIKDGKLITGKSAAIPFGDGYYLFPPKEEKYTVYQSETSGFSYSFLCSIFFDGGYCLVAENDERCRIDRLPAKPLSVESGVTDGGVFFVKYLIDDVYYLRLYSSTDLEEFIITGHTVEIGDGIKSVYSPPDLLRPTIRAEYSVFSGKIRRIAYEIECARAHVSADELIPLLFLQTLAREDAQARNYLSRDLSRNFDDLKEFLGNYEFIYPHHEGFVELAGEEKRFFLFKVEDGLIVDLSEIE